MALDKVLIVDDEDLIRWSLQQKLTNWGYRTFQAPDAQTAIELAESESPDLVLLDIHLPDRNGLEVLQAIKELDARCIVIIMTAYGVLEDAVKALRFGAYDFVSKPLNFEELKATLQNALEAIKLRQELRHFREQDRKRSGVDSIIGESRAITEAVEMMKKVALSPATTVLLQGESGTGKDLFAKAIHYASSRADKPFLAINCAALPENLVESELFGHERGAFTDARQQKKGLLELADGGTILLDEIGEMPLGLQAKLLRVLENQSFKRVGGIQDVRVDVRIIASSNRDLKKMVALERFRQDLYYRLNVITIDLPPLRDRRADVKVLARRFIEDLNAAFGKQIEGLTPQAEALLAGYPWPGNVRELRNAIERAMILEDGPRIGAEAFPFDSGDRHAIGSERSLPSLDIPETGTSLDRVEEELIRQALQRTGGNQTRAAKLLDITRDTLRYKMKKFRLTETNQ
ncbi:MAG TPA: sigma-54 dependent transcriptional regulator [Vicinamibacteria bacterium]|nr:sigma-54 dependent transcriptional regulator [Vicinamibacteria bacterium]